LHASPASWKQGSGRQDHGQQSGRIAGCGRTGEDLGLVAEVVRVAEAVRSPKHHNELAAPKRATMKPTAVPMAMRPPGPVVRAVSVMVG
jgi:hypothetical protein